MTKKNKTKTKIINIVADTIFCVSIGWIFLICVNNVRNDILRLHWSVWLLVVASVVVLGFALINNSTYITNEYSQKSKPLCNVAIILKLILAIISIFILFVFLSSSGGSAYDKLGAIFMGIVALVFCVPIIIAYLVFINGIKKIAKSTELPISLFGIVCGLTMIIMIFFGFVYPLVIEPGVIGFAKGRAEDSFRKYDGCSMKNIAATREYGITIATVGPCTENSALISYKVFYTDSYAPREGKNFLGTFEYNPVAELERAIPGSATHQQKERGGTAGMGDTYIIAEGNSWDMFMDNYLQIIEDYMAQQDSEVQITVWLFNSYNGHKEDLKSLVFPHSNNFTIRDRFKDVEKDYGIKVVDHKVLFCHEFNGIKCQLYDATNKIGEFQFHDF